MALTALNTLTDRSNAAVQTEMCAQKGKIAEFAQEQFKVKKMTEEIAAEFPLTVKLLGQTAQECAFMTAVTLQAAQTQSELVEVSVQTAGQVSQLKALLQNANPIDLLEAVTGDVQASLQKQNSRLATLEARAGALEHKLSEMRSTRISLAQDIAELKKAL